jgi:hypothetical protein
VYSYPDGSSYVRAPFVSVYSPAWGYIRPGYAWSTPTQDSVSSDARATPNSESLGEETWRSLRARIREGADRLDRSLARVESNGEWRRYLRTTDLVDLVIDDIDEPPGPDETWRLEEILSKYQATLNSSNMGRITTSDGFRDVFAALSEYVTAPQERKRRQFETALRQLERDLERINAGSSWYRYLRLSGRTPSASATDPIAPPSDTASADRLEGLHTMLRHYEHVSQDARYRVIAELPGFQSAHMRLHQYVDALTEAGADDGEELPPPEPQPPAVP